MGMIVKNYEENGDGFGDENRKNGDERGDEFDNFPPINNKH